MPPPEPASGAAPTETELDAHLRRVDPDRRLAARLVSDPHARYALLALYALDEEIARVPQSVTQPMLGEMRLAWWGEALEAAAAGQAQTHPALQAVAPALRSGALRMEDLAAILAARAQALEPAPFADEAALVGWIDATAGGVMRAAARLLDPSAPPEATRSAARAWGWTGLLRAEPAWRARNRRWAPLDWGEDPSPAELATRVAVRAQAALAEAATELRRLPVASFPAVAYARFVRDDLRGRAPGELTRRAQVVWASVLGRV